MLKMRILPDKPPKISARLLQLLPLIVFISGISVWLWRMSYVTLWSDEFSGTLQIIQLPWQDILRGNYAWDFNPPLYFLILKGWVTLVGHGDEAKMRMLSIFISSGSMIAIYFFGKRIGNLKVGAALMSVIAFHPVFQYYSTDLRMYSLLIFLSILALTFYASYLFDERASKGWLLALGITIALASYTHYFGVLVGLIIAVFALVARARKKTRITPLLGTLLLSIILSLPVLQILIRQYTRYVEKSTSEAIRYPILGAESMAALLSGSVSFDFQVTDTFQVLSLLAVIGGLVVLWRNDRKTTALALIASVCLSWLAAFAISTYNIGLAPRYLIHVFLLSWVIAALSLIETWDPLSRFLRVLTIMAVSATVYVGISSAAEREYPIPDWREAAQILEREAFGNEPIVIMGWDAAPTGYYLDKDWLTSYDLEKQLVEGGADSYLILDSIHARKLEVINYSNVLYENAQEGVRILRYVPVRGSSGPAPP
jgi:4-amino-4-deoxy-L-arabinose transferase-like glycosyltransferase